MAVSGPALFNQALVFEFAKKNYHINLNADSHVVGYRSEKSAPPGVKENTK